MDILLTRPISRSGTLYANSLRCNSTSATVCSENFPTIHNGECTVFVNASIYPNVSYTYNGVKNNQYPAPPMTNLTVTQCIEYTTNYGQDYQGEVVPSSDNVSTTCYVNGFPNQNLVATPGATVFIIDDCDSSHNDYVFRQSGVCHLAATCVCGPMLIVGLHTS